jgi:hypothetical protein
MRSSNGARRYQVQVRPSLKKAVERVLCCGGAVLRGARDTGLRRSQLLDDAGMLQPRRYNRWVPSDEASPATRCGSPTSTDNRKLSTSL